MNSFKKKKIIIYIGIKDIRIKDCLRKYWWCIKSYWYYNYILGIKNNIKKYNI